MDCLILVPSEKEYALLEPRLKLNSGSELLSCGPGPVHSALGIQKALTKHPKKDLVVLAGIAGAYSRFGLGEVVKVMSDQFADLGAEDSNKKLLNPQELGFGDEMPWIFNNPYPKPLVAALAEIPMAKGITVSLCSGSKETIQERVKTYGAEIETMEGASFSLVMQNSELAYLHLRAISNKVEERDLSNWEIDLAIKNLGHSLNEVMRTPL